jgi:hypothetical protein
MKKNLPKTIYMKKNIRTIVALLFASALLVTGCTKNNDPVDSNTPISQVITQGSWIVHYYFENGTDETSDFSGYSFTFAASGSFTATKSGVATNGTWSEITDDGKKKLVLNLATADPKLDNVNDDWVIVSKSNSLIELKDDNPARDEQLHFKKL